MKKEYMVIYNVGRPVLVRASSARLPENDGKRPTGNARIGAGSGD